MAQRRARDILRAIAEHAGVCVRPLAIARINVDTGQKEIIDIPCGARIAATCKPCAERNRRLRQTQIREGWHLTAEPTVPPDRPDADTIALMRTRAGLLFDRDVSVRGEDWHQVRDLDQRIADIDTHLSTRRLRGCLPEPGSKPKPRTVRSTKRRQDAPKLPRHNVAATTVGRVYRAKDGAEHRPSMLITPTLPSFGSVHTGNRMRRGRLHPCECGHLHGQHDPLLGTPLDPDSYDYRAQALALIFFAPLLDRFWQNYRRAAGWKIQYAGVVEMQRRLAAHAHYAVRGTVNRKLTRQVASATYHQVWWPAFDTTRYSVDRPPEWDDDENAYLDPVTRRPLRSWDDAIAALTDDATPAHVAQLGTVDVKGITGGTKDADRAIRYTTKYLTKDLVDTTLIRSPEQQDHADRLHGALSTLPCSPRCANWLLYGVQPKDCKPDLTPGRCRGKVHQRATLGYTGRRCLVSRNWSGKTLTDHRLDGRDWFRALTPGLLDQGHQAAENTDESRYIYRLVSNSDRDIDALADRIQRSIAARDRARQALLLARAGPGAVPATPLQPAPPAALAA